MPQASNCPVCAQTAELPAAVALGDHLVCPACRTEYVLLEMLHTDAADLPEAVVIDSASGAESILDDEPKDGSSTGRAVIVRGGDGAAAVEEPPIATEESVAVEQAPPPLENRQEDVPAAFVAPTDEWRQLLDQVSAAAAAYWAERSDELARRERIIELAMRGDPPAPLPIVVRPAADHDDGRSDYDLAPGQVSRDSKYDRSDLEIPDVSAPSLDTARSSAARSSTASATPATIALAGVDTENTTAADRARAVRKPSGKSALRLLVEVIFGGVLAVVIVEAILTYGMKRPGPFGLYKQIPAEWLPENLRPVENEE